MKNGTDGPNFNIADLWPKFDTLLSTGVSEPSGLSAAFISFLLLTFLGTLTFAIWNTIAAHRRISAISSALKGVSSKALLQERRSIRKRIKHRQGSALWGEFDESLVVAPDGSRLYNTIDAAHFFNESTLAHGITQNRFLAAVPGFLTAIGVIGTFVGLTLGLSSINGAEGASSPDEIEIGIYGLLSGASIAFLTSVWGVTTSVIFNVAEKFMERSVRTKIQKLQSRIDTLFPRITPEAALLEISDHGRQSRETLQGLAEQIGERMQKAVGDMNERMREALEDTLRNVLQPAVEALVKNQEQISLQQAEGSQKALQDLVERFMDGMTAEGRQQQETLEQTAGAFRETAGQFTHRLTRFVEGIESQRQEQERAQSKQAAAFGQQLDQLSQAQEEQGKRLNDALDGLLGKLSTGMERLNTQTAEADRARETALEDYTKKLSEAGEKTIERLSNMVEEQQAAVQRLIDQSTDLLRLVRDAGAGLETASGSFAKSTENLDDVASRLLEFGSGLSNATHSLATQIANAADRVDRAAQSNSEIHEKSTELLEQADRVRLGLQEAGATLKQAGETAERGFTGLQEHHEAFLGSLRDELDSLAQRVADLLKDYAEHVNGQTTERLNEWNRQTAQYTSTMTNAIQSINDVVDEIETKVRA